MRIKGGTSWLLEINTIIEDWDVPNLINTKVWFKSLLKIPSPVWVGLYLIAVINFIAFIVYLLYFVR